MKYLSVILVSYITFLGFIAAWGFTEITEIPKKYVTKHEINLSLDQINLCLDRIENKIDENFKFHLNNKGG